MKRKNLFAPFLVCLVLVLGGFNAFGDSQSISIVLEGDPETTAVLKQMLKENPQLAVHDTQTEYTIRVIRPDPSVDYRIMKVTPDPSVDYKIIIVDPQSRKKLPDLSRQVGDDLQEKLRQKLKESGEKLFDLDLQPGEAVEEKHQQKLKEYND